MPVLPDKKLEQIEFAEQHAPVWGPVAAAIGLSASEVTAIQASAGACRASYEAAQAARLASKAATTQLNNDVRAMNTLVGDAIKAIRLFAESTDNPDVFATAQIPPPAAPTPAKPPTQPIELRAIIESMGGLTIEWKAGPASPAQDASTTGVLYIVRRRLAGEAAFTMVGVAQPTRAGKRGFSSFTDDTLPSNPAGLQYVIQAQRGQLQGPASSVFNITLGSGADGGFTVQGTSLSSNHGIKMAA